MLCSSIWFITYVAIATCETTAHCDSDDATCTTSPGQRSSALLQVAKKVSADVPHRRDVAITGENAPLTSDGYDAVVELCCAQEMIIFIKRLIEENNKKVCGSGGLPGLAIYHDCEDDGNTFETLLEDILNEDHGDCSWLVDVDKDCPAELDCPSFPSATLPPCAGDTPPSDTPPTVGEPPADEPPPPSADEPPAVSRPTPNKVAPIQEPPAPSPTPPQPVQLPPAKCCKSTKQASLFLNTVASRAHKRAGSAVSSIKPFDCDAYKGAIQVMSKKNHYDISQLDIPTGKYDLVYKLPLSLTTPAFKAINGVAINPTDGLAYGILRWDKNGPAYLVRFDKVAIEFVAKVKGYSVVGTFSSKGDFYYMKGGVYVIRDVSTMKGFASKDDKGLNDFSNEQAISEAKVTVQDLVAYNGDLEGTGIPSEYIIALDKSDKLLVVKDAGPQSATWLLKTTGCGETKGFGAGWNFNGRVYFSGNTGAGVYEIPVATMDVNAGSVMVKRVGESEATSKNDGMNCMEAETPFPDPEDDGCGVGYQEVPAEDGKCPDGSFRA